MVYLASCLFQVAPAQGANLNWTNTAGSANFTNANVWSPVGVPGAGDTVNFNNNNTYTVQFSSSVTNAQAIFGANSSGTVTLNVGTGNIWWLTNSLGIGVANNLSANNVLLTSGTLVATNGNENIGGAYGGAYGSYPSGVKGSLTVSNATALLNNVYLGIGQYVPGWGGQYNSGTLNLVAGAQATLSQLTVGASDGVYGYGGSGSVVIANSSLTVNGSTSIGGGSGGVGLMQITGSNSTGTFYNLTIANGSAGAQAQLVVSGSTVVVGNVLNIGLTGNSTGTMTINNGSVVASNLIVATAGSGTIWLNGGQLIATNSFTDFGTSTSSGGQLIVSNGMAMFSSMNLGHYNSSTLTVAGGTVTFSGTLNLPSIYGSGNDYVWLVGGTMSVTGGVNAGNGQGTGYGQVVISNNAVLIANSLSAPHATDIIANFGGVYEFTTNSPTITVGSGGTIAINNGTIAFLGVSSGLNLTNNWKGSGLTNLAWSGNNALRLDNSLATNTLAGGYTFDTGRGATNYYRLEMINGNTAVAGNGITIGANGALLVSNTVATFGSVVTNSGGVVLVNSTNTFSSGLVNQGTITNNNNNMIGLLTMNNGTLVTAGGAAQTWASNINLAATGNFDTSGGNLTLAGAVTNGGSLVKVGTGVLTLAATNTYLGGTVVQAGTLLLGNALALNGTALTVNGGIFDPNSNAVIVSTLNGSGGVVSNYGLTVAGGGNYSGVIAGTGGLVNTGSASSVLILSGNNTYSGGTTISNGALRAASNNALSSGLVTNLPGGALQLANNVTVGNTLALFGTGVANDGALRNSSGNNSYTGVVTLGSDARINSDANQLTISNLNNNSFNLTVGGASTTLVAGVISGGGGLVKDGSGVLMLKGPQVFTGATTVNNGTLAVNGSLYSAGGVTVATNGTLAGNATLGTVTISGGGTLAPGNNGIGAISAATLNLATNSQMAFDFSTGARSYDQIQVTSLNGLTVNGAALSLYQANSTTPFDLLGSYKLIQYTGTLAPTATNLLSVADATQNRLYGFSLSGGWVTLSISSTGGLGWVGSAVNNFWSTPANWAGSSVPQAGDQLVFDGYTGLNNTNNLTAYTQFSGIYFNTSAGAFTLNGNAVDLIDDVINLSPRSQTINLPLVLAASGLVFNTANGNVVITGAISETNGAFGLTKDGAATLFLTGANTYSGGTILDAGTLSVGAISDSGISGISTSGVLAFNGGALQYTGAGAASTLRGVTNIGIAYIDVTNNAAQLTLGGVISGGNGLTKFGAGTLVLAGTNTYSGGTTINNGTVAISADFNLGAAGEALILGGGTLEATTNLALDSTRPITLNSPGGTFNVDTNSTLTVGNTINNGTGSGALTKTGVGTLVLSNAANNYSGGTVINAGILALGSDGATNENAGALGSGLVTITGNSQLRLGGGANLSYSIGNGIALSNGVIYAAAGVQNLTGSLTVNSGGGTLSAQAGTNDLFLTGVVSGSGALTVFDTGTTSSGRGLVRFANNNNTYSGTLTISSNGNNGVVSVDATTALQFATVNDVSGYGNSLVFYQATAGTTNFTLGALSGTANITLQTWTNTAAGDPLVTGSAVTLTVGGNSNNTTYSGALGGSGALVKTGTGIMTLSGANTNSGGVTVSSGTVLLSGGDNRLFTNGAVTVAGGTLNLGGFTQSNGNTFAILGGILTNGTVAKSGANYLGQSGTISATLGGSAGLTKSTTGTLTLNGTQSYTGTTTVSNGTLVVNGALFGAGLVNVLNNATLTGNATLGNVMVGTGGSLSPGNNGIGTLTMATLTTASGSQFNFDFTTATNDQLYVTANNGLTVTGGVFTLYQAGTTQTFDALGTYNLIDYAGSIGGLSVTNFTVANTIGNRSYTFGINSGWVTLTIAGQGVGWNGSVSAFWSNTNNWNGGVIPTNGIAVFNGNTQTATINDLADHAVLAGITFDTQAPAFSLSGNSINLEGDVSNLSSNVQTINLPLVLAGSGGTRTFNASNGTLIVNGVISETNGPFSVVKEGTNLLVLAGANTYSGGTVLNAGTLGIGTSSVGSTGAVGTGTLFIHAGSLLATNGAQTLNNAVGVVGNLSVGGSQDLTLAGTIDLSNATRTLTINNTANTIIAGAVSNGALTKAGAGLLTVTGTVAYNGATTINGGTLQLGNGGNSGTINNSAAVTNNGVLALDRSDNLTFNNLITGTGSVVQNGTNIVTLSNGSSSYSGATVVNGGVLSVGGLSDGGAASPIGAANSAASNLVLNGGALQYTGSGATVDRLFTVGDNGGTLSAYSAALNFTNTGAVGMSGTNSRTLVLSGSGTGLLAASVGDPTSGQTALLKSGNGQWVLSNTNTFSGTTTISGGTLLLAGALAVQNSTVNNLINGGLAFSNSSAFTLGGLTGSGSIELTNTSGGSITLSVGNNNSSTTYLGVLSGSGALAKLGSGTLTLSTNQTYVGGTTVSAGTLQLGGLSNTLSTNGAIAVAGGVLNLGGASQFTTNSVTLSSGSLVNGTLTKSGADYNGQGGTVAAVLAGNVGLTKTTGGTLALNGTNTYTGTTTISGGTLQVNGKLLTTGLVTVASGATLAGNGGTVGNVTVSSGGIAAPGISGVGLLTLTSLNVTNGSLFNYDFSGIANDQLFVTATNGLTLNGGDFRLYQAGTTTPFDSLGTYRLISYAGQIQGSGTNHLLVDPTTQIGNRLYTFGTNGGWITLTIAGQGVGWLGANSAVWSDPGNWAGNLVPTNGIAVFTGNSQLDTTNDLVNARFAGITFTNGAGAFTLNSALAGANTVTLQGDVVNLSSNTQTINLPLLIAGAQGGKLNASNADIVVAGNITFDSYGSGLLKTGPNVLELTGNNTYTQTTTIAGGILRVTSGALSPNSNLIFTNGILESRGVMALTRSLGTGAGSIQWAGSGGFAAQGGTLTVNLGNAGGTLVWGASSFVPNGSTLQFSSSQADSTVKFMNALNLNGGVRTIQVDQGSAFLDVDMIGAISGTGGSGLIKTGAGTMRLSADSTISGPVTVNAGTLLLASTLTSAGVAVSSGATVGGTGIFDSALTLASGAILSPGQGGAGLLTVNSLNLSSGFVYDWELGMTATDQVDVTTLNGLNYFGSDQWTLQLGAEPGVSALAQWQGSDMLTNSFVLFQFNGLAPASLTNAVILGGGGWDASQAKVTVVGNQVLLSGVSFNQAIAVIPEPNVLLMWLAGTVTLWVARRRQRSRKAVV